MTVLAVVLVGLAVVSALVAASASRPTLIAAATLLNTACLASVVYALDMPLLASSWALVGLGMSLVCLTVLSRAKSPGHISPPWTSVVALALGIVLAVALGGILFRREPPGQPFGQPGLVAPAGREDIAVIVATYVRYVPDILGVSLLLLAVVVGIRSRGTAR